MFPPKHLLQPPTLPVLAQHAPPLARAQAQLALLSAQTSALARQADALTQHYTASTHSSSSSVVEGIDELQRHGEPRAGGAALSTMAELVAKSDRLMLETARLVAGSGPWTQEEGEGELSLPLPE